MPKRPDIWLYLAVLMLGLGGVALIETLPGYMFEATLVYGGF